MNDLEDRLRTTLGDLADGVPASQHARADLDRRLASRRTRRATLAVAAAAAVVLAGVAIPVALNRGGDEPGGQRAATATTSPPTTITEATGDKPYEGKLILRRYTEGGVEKSVGLAPEGDQFCFFELVPPGQPARPNECQLVPVWPQPETPSIVHTAPIFAGGALHGGPLSNLLLFVTAPNVDTLEVTAGDGEQAEVSLLVRRPNATYFLAVFPETSAGFGYTAKDAAGTVLETAIT